MDKNDIFDALISTINAMNDLLALAHAEGLSLSPTATVVRQTDGKNFIFVQLVTPEESEEDYVGQ